MPSISKQNGAVELLKEKEKEVESEQAETSEDTVSPEQEQEEGEMRLSSKTPDLVPKSFQDKRSDNL